MIQWIKSLFKRKEFIRCDWRLPAARDHQCDQKAVVAYVPSLRAYLESPENPDPNDIIGPTGDSDFNLVCHFRCEKHVDESGWLHVKTHRMTIEEYKVWEVMSG